LAFEEVERFLVKEMNKKQIPGLSVAIVKGEDIAWSRGFGYASLEGQTPATSETVYRVASVSKPVLTVGLLKLVERGKLSLDDPVNELMDRVKIRTSFKMQPTVRNLLTHTSGLPVHVDPIYFNPDEAVPLEEMIRESAIAVRPPNEEIVYSNTAFNIIGYLIGLLSGRPYPRYMEEEVFKPLEMFSSSFEQTPQIRRLMAQPYTMRPGGRIEPVKPWFGGSTPEKPCGSLFSTATDLGHFLISQMNGGYYKGRRILKEETIEEMQRLQASAGASRSGYALSWKRGLHYGRPMLSHTGGNLGWTAHMAFYPEVKTGVVILCNFNDNTGWRPPAKEALLLLAGGIPPFNPNAVMFEPAPEGWGRLVGIYTRDFQDVHVKMEKGHLILEMGPSKSYLEPIEEARFLVHGDRSDGMELTFEFDENGFAKQFDLETEVYRRYVEDKRVVEENIELKGVWTGNYVIPYGYFTMELAIYDGDKAEVKGMSGETVPLLDFEAHHGRVKGRARFKVPYGYVGWGAEEYEVEFNLKAIEGKLEGLMTLKSVLGESKVHIILSKKLD
jgi:CubicO group peptidase (beta-lactamase class C family)